MGMDGCFIMGGAARWRIAMLFRCAGSVSDETVPFSDSFMHFGEAPPHELSRYFAGYGGFYGSYSSQTGYKVEKGLLGIRWPSTPSKILL